MIVGIYAVHDAKAGAYMAPFTLANDGMAKRSFINEVGRPDSLVGQNPGDFVLVRLGSFDDLTGVVNSTSPDEMFQLMTGLEARSLVEERGA